MEWIVTEAAITDIATAFWQMYNNSRIFAFHSEMGAGKTTFINSLCAAKKVSSHVGSPTFSIINEYSYPGGEIFHIDLYRLKNEEEIFKTGVEDCLYSGEICMIEWAEKAEDILPEDTVHVYIYIIDPVTRKIHTEPTL